MLLNFLVDKVSGKLNCLCETNNKGNWFWKVEYYFTYYNP